jgi:hypothetical protein
MGDLFYYSSPISFTEWFFFVYLEKALKMEREVEMQFNFDV